ncbi:uncharacterized protein EV422DRAFT_23505 [Fimicolochytrium jonesii]|uniref:uncharacterized protein n=1 Tax=Fimicolochytrium jonesii TaxID=1396493 RepID=UPI0022FE4682|nr:uncharacterized protein EV422DRAFT_23505 [Fimicolochytrium jonesii]KAI8827049.1 hypothetical protein EV422DRAFT_23505 [Fimicolochytrium jonesii]
MNISPLGCMLNECFPKCTVALLKKGPQTRSNIMCMTRTTAPNAIQNASILLVTKERDSTSTLRHSIPIYTAFSKSLLQHAIPAPRRLPRHHPDHKSRGPLHQLVIPVHPGLRVENVHVGVDLVEVGVGHCAEEGVGVGVVVGVSFGVGILGGFDGVGSTGGDVEGVGGLAVWGAPSAGILTESEGLAGAVDATGTLSDCPDAVGANAVDGSGVLCDGCSTVAEA